jgi:hypothetical protein
MSMALLALCVGLTGCVPPPSVPFGASTSYDWYSGHFTYTWRRTVPTGCAVWMATEQWADVQLIVDSRCEGRPEEGYLDGRGLSYFSSSDFLEFHGYWPWTQEEYFDLIEFDSEGMTSNIRPCPHSLLPDQMDELRVLAREALGSATSDAERRMMARVVERLAVANGAALASGQAACTDLPPDWFRGMHPKQDPWTSR